MGTRWFMAPGSWRARISRERSRLVHWISLVARHDRQAARRVDAHDEVGHGEVGALFDLRPARRRTMSRMVASRTPAGRVCGEVVRAGTASQNRGVRRRSGRGSSPPAPRRPPERGHRQARLQPSQLPSQGATQVDDVELAAWAAASPTRVLRLLGIAAAAGKGGDSAHAERLWPTTTVLHGSDDKTVPVQSARDFVHALAGVVEEEPDGGGGESSRARGRVRYVEYERAGHGEVMIALLTASGDELPQIARDFVREACSA